jgi:hypothetical protein
MLPMPFYLTSQDLELYNQFWLELSSAGRQVLAELVETAAGERSPSEPANPGEAYPAFLLALLHAAIERIAANEEIGGSPEAF